MSKIFWKRLAVFFDWIAFGVGAMGATVLGLTSGKLQVASLTLGIALFAVSMVLYWAVTAVLHLATVAGQQVD
jgi:hypothetical protein